VVADRRDAESSALSRRLGLFDAVVIGLGAILGAGVFAAFAPAAQAAGSGLLIGLAVAAVVAYCNATSSARLAALYPESGGTYVYGRRRLGEFWGYQAGWAFVVGKTASCAAMGLTFGSYAAPDHIRLAGILAVVLLTATNYFGVQKSAWLTRLIVLVTVVTLTIVIVGSLGGGTARVSHLAPFPGSSVRGILQSAGLLFFAFAGYARIATLGEEVRQPTRTIPRAIGIALVVSFSMYALVAAAALLATGPHALASTTAPLRTALEVGRFHALGPLVRIGASAATLGSLLSLLLGISRTSFAMARDRNLPGLFDAVHPRYGVPHRAEIAVGAVVATLVATLDLRGAIGFSSFGVLVYYGIANASAFTLGAHEGPPRRWVPILGVFGCAVLALALPLAAVLTGAAVLLLGSAAWAVRRRLVSPH
jgi:basic amino acid/polyamine antiporter, APA family